MSLVFEVNVIPSSGKTAWKLNKNGRLICYLKNPPERGKANKELVEFIAKSVSCPQHAIEIVRGLSVRKKIIKITLEYSYEQFLNKIGLKDGEQGALF